MINQRKAFPSEIMNTSMGLVLGVYSLVLRKALINFSNGFHHHNVIQVHYTRFQREAFQNQPHKSRLGDKTELVQTIFCMNSIGSMNLPITTLQIQCGKPLRACQSV